jgi:hypothetical protein
LLPIAPSANDSGYAVQSSNFQDTESHKINDKSSDLVQSSKYPSVALLDEDTGNDWQEVNKTTSNEEDPSNDVVPISPPYALESEWDNLGLPSESQEESSHNTVAVYQNFGFNSSQHAFDVHRVNRQNWTGQQNDDEFNARQQGHYTWHHPNGLPPNGRRN